MPIAIADAADPLAVDPSEKCVIMDCKRRPILRARLRTEATNHEWRDVPMCVWHRMAAGTINGDLFDGNGNLLPQYKPTMIDGLVCFIEDRKAQF